MKKYFLIIFALLSIGLVSLSGMESTENLQTTESPQLLPASLTPNISTPENLDLFASKIETLLTNMMSPEPHKPSAGFGSEPPITVKEWIKHLFRQNPRSTEILQLNPWVAFGGIILLKRLLKRVTAEKKLAQCNVYRLFMVACLLAYKTLDEDASIQGINAFWTNEIIERWRLCYPLAKINQCEYEFLTSISHEAYISNNELIEFAKEYEQLKQKDISSTSSSPASSSVIHVRQITIQRKSRSSPDLKRRERHKRHIGKRKDIA